MRASFDSLPQENYKLIDFNWDKTLEKLRNSKLIVGDLTDEEIGRTKDVLCAHVRVKDQKVSFNVSFFGKIQLSNPNRDLLRRSRSILRNLIVCTGWSPIAEVPQPSNLSERFEKRLEAIRQANLSNPSLAYADLLLFIGELPSHIQNSLGEEFLLNTIAIKKSGERRFFEEQTQTRERVKFVTSLAVLSCINKISMLLNEEN